MGVGSVVYHAKSYEQRSNVMMLFLLAFSQMSMQPTYTKIPYFLLPKKVLETGWLCFDLL